ncbi:P-loop containing nucleoside triphosphate hydrolase protein [Flagelloscypha sp. PMI_526]|nr:P-loop containing nucleoside triphosphate hydrolase protein [Flagelloscypha sp. PMI_526]
MRLRIPLARSLSTTIINIPTANVYRFGDPNSARPVIHDLEWKVRDDESWAILGSSAGEKSLLFDILLGHLRLSPPPPPPGIFPAFRDDSVARISFGHRPQSSGGFYDYSARYGAVRDADRITLRQALFPQFLPRHTFDIEKEGVKLTLSEDLNANQESTPPHEDLELFEDLIDRVGLREFLDLPMIALSNGQTRRARIVKGILKRPQLLLLDEPLSGLDAASRPSLQELLHSLHVKKSPRLILGIRNHEHMPDWITHVASLQYGKVVARKKDDATEILPHQHLASENLSSQDTQARATPGAPLIQLEGISVKYGDRQVLKNIHWTVREGERWHLKGPNGSGKTTLTSLITGDHPQSYTQGPALTLFNCLRSRIPTPLLQSKIGLLSPELFDAFPRRGMTVWEVIGTGFDGTFISKGKFGVGIGFNGDIDDQEIRRRVSRCDEVLKGIGPDAWATAWTELGVAAPSPPPLEDYKGRLFASLSTGEQRVVLLMRALVNRPPLVILDEVWSGMDEGMILAVKNYLRSDAFDGKQAVIVITHWSDEVPWTSSEGLKHFSLEI